MPRKPPRNNICRLRRRVAGRSIDWRPEKAVSEPSHAKIAPPWTSTEELERHAIGLLIHLYCQPRENVRGFLKQVRFESHDGIALIGHLENRGFVQDVTADGIPSAYLTDAGCQFAKKCIKRLKPARRATALRKRLLLWLSSDRGSWLKGDDWDDSWLDASQDGLYADYYGTVVTKGEIVRETIYLTEHRLIAGDSSYDPSFGNLSHLRLTARGRDCIDGFGGDVAEYLNLNRDSRPNIRIENSTGIVTGSGTVSNIVVGNGNATNATSGVDTSALTTFLDHVRKDLPNIDFDTEEAREDVEDDLEKLEDEAQESYPNVGILQKLLARLAKGLGRAAYSEVQQGAIELANEVMKELGQ